MFISREFLDSSAPPTTGRTMAACSSVPSFASTAPPRLPGTAWGEEEEVSTPVSAANMRTKMLQHRQTLLAKQRQNAMGVSGNVMSGAGLPLGKVGTPTMGLRSTSAANLGHGFQSLVDDDDNDSVADVSQDRVVAISPEEQARRRSDLMQDMAQRGISVEYDPTAISDPKAQPSFHVKQIAPEHMKAFLHSPTPKEAGLLQCRVVRDRNGLSNRVTPRFVMQSDDGIFLMTAQKQQLNKHFHITTSRSDYGKEDPGYLGKVRSDFLGVEWMAYGPGVSPAKADAKQAQHVREELLAVQYTVSRWGASPKGPQQMVVHIPHVQQTGERIVCQTLHPEKEGLLALRKQPAHAAFVDRFRNKAPKWNDQKQVYVLNFNKRVTEASVKNFQLVDDQDQSDPDKVFLQFGRTGKDTFNLDFQHPISPFQAFALCLSSFEFKLGVA